MKRKLRLLPLPSLGEGLGVRTLWAHAVRPYHWRNDIIVGANHRQAKTRQNDLAIITQTSLEPVKMRANWQFFGKKVI
ncbi:MAG: hypothetical protein IM496_12040 [Microcystis sp. M049S2]|uniref:hypothetical protein n=1 Tax=Microcystis sp. M049S2 TaxID=2771169 RepID=UPI002589699A|nr:hypothetical protein [Microcystis sp. M049S2]MCA2659204.1 hypothetical protein [Microcystis sp. M049S2]